MLYRHTLLPVLLRVEAETAHETTLRLLSLVDRWPAAYRLLRRLIAVDDARLRVHCWNLQFGNPLGIAAGLDKNAVAVHVWGALGWGHVEVGTVTPLPQAGNPRPRLFRLPQDRAVINRMGFPGEGALAVRMRLARRPWDAPPVGVNLGANRASVEAGRAIADYLTGLETFAARAAYLAINISSPNTAGLRALQHGAALDELLEALSRRRAALRPELPLLLKLAPDLDDAALEAIADAALRHGWDGLVATNTTLARPAALRSPARDEAGGLSGAPLRARSTAVIRRLRQASAGRLPIIGVGGVFTADDVLEKLAAGATLVQVYTGMLYEGPLMARRICLELLHRLEQSGARALGELVGAQS